MKERVVAPCQPYGVSEQQLPYVVPVSQCRPIAVPTHGAALQINVLKPVPGLSYHERPSFISFLCHYIPCSAFLYILRWSDGCVTICHRLAWIHQKFSVQCTEAFAVGCFVACCSINRHKRFSRLAVQYIPNVTLLRGTHNWCLACDPRGAPCVRFCVELRSRRLALVLIVAAL